VISRAQMLAKKGGDRSAMALADLHCRRARRRIGERFGALFDNDDKATNLVAKRFLEGELTWLEEGIVPLDSYREAAAAAPKGSPDAQPARARAPEPARAR
jgi:hypothetical protein